MNRNKLSLIIAGLAALALVLGGWFVGVQPQLASAATSAQQRSDIDSRNDTVRAELTRLEQQYKALGTLKSELATLESSIPDSTDTTPFIKELNQLADANAVSISPSGMPRRTSRRRRRPQLRQEAHRLLRLLRPPRLPPLSRLLR
jgi:Tfp pilus assembly protein PilO